MTAKTLLDFAPTTTIGPEDLLYAVLNVSTSPVDASIELDDLFKSRNGNESVTAYASLSAAVTAIGSNVATLEVPSTLAVTADLTVPSNITLLFIGAGVLSVSSTKTLIISGPIVAPVRQIFSGAGTVRLGAKCSTAFPEWFGAVMNGTTDDQAAAQKAIDAFAPVGNSPLAGEVLITGYMAIGSTLTISSTNVALRGFGWAGSQSAETRSGRSVIRWIGSAGSPMILIHALGCKIESLRLKGKSTAKPSSAIEISESGGVFCDNTSIRDVWIGSLYGFDDDNAVQLTRGIYFSGSVDSDTNSLFRVFINACTTGIDIANPNASVNHFDTIQTTFCTTGLKTVAPQIVVTNWICAGNDVDLEMAAQGCDVTLNNYVSEGSGRMAIGSAVAPHRLVVNGGGFQADGTSGAKFETGDADYSGKRAFIQFKGNTAIATYIELRNFSLTNAGTPATPIVQAWNTSDNTTPSGSTAVHLVLKGVRGFTSNNIAVGSDGYTNSERIVEFDGEIYSQANPNQTRFIQNSGYGSSDNDYQDGRFDLLGKANIYGGPLYVKALPLPVGVAATPTGSGATSYSYKVTALTHDGETLASTAATCTNGTLGTGGRLNTVSWYPVHGARAYKVYGRTGGSELLMATVAIADIPFGCLWVDNGSVTPSGALPTINTTGNAKVDGIFSGGKGTDVASASTISPTGNVFHVTGTTTITSVSGTGILAATEITIIFDGVLTFTDGSNLKLAGNFVTTADDTITLIYDGANYYEKCRSAN